MANVMHRFFHQQTGGNKTRRFHVQGGGFKHFLFSILLGEMIQFDYFWDGLKPPTSVSLEIEGIFQTQTSSHKILVRIFFC